MTDEEMRKDIITSLMLSVPREEECLELCNYSNGIFQLANIGKILTECLHFEFGLKGTKKEPLVDIFVTGGSNTKRLIVRNLPRTEEMDEMIHYINEMNFVNSLKERNKHDATTSN